MDLTKAEGTGKRSSGQVSKGRQERTQDGEKGAGGKGLGPLRLADQRFGWKELRGKD